MFLCQKIHISFSSSKQSLDTSIKLQSAKEESDYHALRFLNHFLSRKLGMKKQMKTKITVRSLFLGPIYILNQSE